MLPAGLVAWQWGKGKLTLGLGLLHRLIQTALLEAALDETLNAPSNLPADARDILVVRREGWHELHRAIGALMEDAAGKDGVKMGLAFSAPPSKLGEGHGEGWTVPSESDRPARKRV